MVFTSQSGESTIEVRVQDDTVWLTQNLIAELFQTTKQNVSLHLKNIFQDGELDEISVVKKSLTTASGGKNYKTKFYNLDAIISIGYRVNSQRAKQFRQWVTFEHLLAEIREIRLSERRFYQKITDIYATAMDYNWDAQVTKEFFSKVQNKLHYAVHGHTAAELIISRANAEKEHMGLTSWEKSSDGKIVKTDVAIAKTT